MADQEGRSVSQHRGGNRTASDVTRQDDAGNRVIGPVIEKGGVPWAGSSWPSYRSSQTVFTHGDPVRGGVASERTKFGATR